ncbi:uncharacterized protein TNCV_1084151 [Trichonephila clavipes]|nr:uncharacterized protein TNCV_1084151 [Trichonephila clavipes]
MHNAHKWALNNPNSTRPSAIKQRFTLNVRVSIVGDSLIDPYILAPQLDSDKYLVFLQEVLPELTDVPASVWHSVSFQLDGAPSDYGRCARNHLDRSFPYKWIRRGSPVT